MLTELTGLITWWKEQMRDLVPASLRPTSQTWRRVLVADLSDAHGVTLSLRSRSGTAPLGRFGLGGSDLRDAVASVPKARRKSPILVVSPALFLEREVVLPLNADHELARVVAYDMDRLTPFRAEEVFWICMAEKRDPVRGRLHARVTLLPRARIQPVLSALAQAGFHAASIEARDAGRRRAIPLAAILRDRGWLGPRTDTYAAAGCCFLAVAAVATPFILQSLASASLDTRIEAMQPRVAQADRLRKAITSGVTTADAIAAARNQVGVPLQAIALLTEMLPDDTFLISLSARQRKVTISGRSAAAARLIGAMASHPLIHDPAFTAPVIRDETNGGEQFSIRAELGT